MSTTTTLLFNFLGLKGSADLETDLSTSQTSEKLPVRALPAKWYTSPQFFSLEHRAIFSKKWLFLTHTSRLAEPGDFLGFELAGFNLIIVKDRTGTINAFHNICRHRAYPVIEDKSSGRAQIFSCRYHGWSYGLNGRLAKAPDYHNLDPDAFNKSENGLMRIHTHIDINGFLWINFSSSTPEPWVDSFVNSDKQARFSQFNFDDYVLDHTYEMKGHYNWKLCAENFNECYHCKTTHPDVPTFLSLDAYDLSARGSWIEHDHAPTPEQKAKGFNVNSSYYAPNASMSISPHFMMIQRFHPVSVNESIMSYEIYRNRHSSDEDFKLISNMYARVMSEDKVLIEGQQKNLDRGVYAAGLMHPRWEKGPLFFQKVVREAVERHWQEEKKLEREIWPARQEVLEGKDEEMCADGGKACVGMEGLEW